MNRKRVLLTLCLFAGIVLLVAACQPTPESAAIANKGDNTLEEMIQNGIPG